MVDTPEINSAPITPQPPISCPPSQYNSPSLSRSPLLSGVADDNEAVTKVKVKVKEVRSAASTAPQTPRRWTPRNLTPRFITPLGSPIRKAMRMTKLDPQDAWLPITESRNGNAFYAAFHTLCSGIGIQALVLPVAFTILGWTWGLINFTGAFIWQLYTLYLLVQLHESQETGMRYCRYLQLCGAAFGEKAGKFMALFPVMYLSGGTCTAIIILGGSTSKLFYQTVSGRTDSPVTTVEWYLVFTCAAVVLSQLPNLNSIAGVSLIGAISAVAYCTMIWIISVVKGRLPGVSYDPVHYDSDLARTFQVFNALGIIAFAFRGHNLILEIQATMPSSEKHPSTKPMWKGTKVAYGLISACLYPIAIGGYWAYGQLIPNAGMLTALYQFHGQDTSQGILGFTSAMVIINAVSSFQIYAMPMFDDMESQFVTRRKKPCPWWLRIIFRTIFAFICFFVSVATPFVGSFSGLVGGIALPVTMAYPCFMWIKIKKPKVYSPMWWLNWVLGILGLALSVIVIASGIYVVVDTGVTFNFFDPQ
ncbi:unnamed protein product [Rhodiola kirilowii]